mmetsp:Transcript_1971/g.3156  ORF Transcript_1971/g.3156 Transcript_1971/m.3156 type:complete len:137 (-) Transcript_1971:166-576(-)
MQGLTSGYFDWVQPMLQRMVTVSEDEEFLKAAHKLSRRRRKALRDLDAFHVWIQDTLDIMAKAMQRKLQLVDSVRPKDPLKDKIREERAPPPGPSTGRHITAISSNQTLQVSGGSIGNDMHVLDPHPGFQSAPVIP